MSLIKKVGISVLVAFIAIQFIRPVPNESKEILPTDIGHIVAVPEHTQALLKAACYNCHSNYTTYPWYAKVQPSAWYLAHHISDGKESLNFSDFGSYSKRKQVNKFKAIAHEVEEGDMPLSSYALMHAGARLSQEDKQSIITWATHAQDSLR